jgi:hypothetical protein
MSSPTLLAATLCIALFMGSPAPTRAQTPSVDTVEGRIEAGTSLVVRGARFGDMGPTIDLYDDFERARPGEPVPLEDPTIGAWSGENHIPLVHALGRSGERSFLAFDGRRARILKLVLGAPRETLLLSYWVRLAPGSPFPGSKWPDGREPGRFSWDSSWKFSWVMNGPRGYLHDDGAFDVCLPTHVGRGSFTVSGNSAPPWEGHWIDNDWWNWEGWTRMTFAIAPASERSEAPHLTSQFVSERGHWIREHATRFGDELPPGKHRFDRVNVPGWIRSGGGEDVRPLYDDIYIASGPGALARVEVANAARYEDATRVELLIPTNWTNDRLHVRVPKALPPFAEDEELYLFVTDAGGRRSREGILLAGCTACPPPPANFAVF